ncbi:MAG: GGDEF domain-containing protein [Hyphomicrobiales bacterium]|nr:GGDEF domain-containing protein [Hyphomicrobiales bacterium]
MTLYIGLLAAITAAVEFHQTGVIAQIGTFAGVFVAASLLSVPIAWEFGRMYLDLWESTQTLSTLARTDQQTGLLNNRTFVAQVEERIAAGRTMALLLADLDRFKSINDRWGHPMGDEVISAVGGVMRNLFCRSAIIGRMGGEEFAVAIECPFDDEAARLRFCAGWAEELRRRIGEIHIPVGDGMIAPTASIGIARSSEDDDFSALYVRADRALYMAKAGGRNRYVDDVDLDFGAAHRQTGVESVETSDFLFVEGKTASI